MATQRPTLLDETITAQLNTKFIFRTVRASDIKTIQEETDLTVEETRRLPYLRTGDVFISSAVLGRTVYGRIRAALTTSPHTLNPFDELKQKMQEKDAGLFAAIKEVLPIIEENLLDTVMDLEKDTGITYGINDLKEKLNQMVEKGYISKEDTIFGSRYKEKESWKL